MQQVGSVNENSSGEFCHSSSNTSAVGRKRWDDDYRHSAGAMLGTSTGAGEKMAAAGDRGSAGNEPFGSGQGF